MSLFLVALGGGSWIRSASPPSSRLIAEQVIIPSTFFGMHIHHTANALGTDGRSQVQFPTRRLWDTGTSWANLEPARGKWNFAVLDDAVEFSRVHNTQLVLTLGSTPTWASSRPTEESFYNPGAGAEPSDMADWSDFVRTVANRYANRIHVYEIWNEPNLKRFWSGSVPQMVQMTAQACRIIKEVDPSAIVISPPPTTSNGLPWLSKFLAAGGGSCVDVIGYHFYVYPEAPEAMVPLIEHVKEIKEENGLGGRPLWDTEAGWAEPKPFPSDRLGADYLARAFILNWASDVRRMYWYAWDNRSWVALETTQTDSRSLRPAGEAYVVVQRWLVGSVMNWCEQGADHTWTCQLEKDGKHRWIVWNPDRQVCLRTDPGWQVRVSTPLLQQPSRVADTCVETGSTPILLEP